MISSVLIATVADPHEPRAVLIELEVHFAAGSDAEPFAHRLRDRHLAFARHAHERKASSSNTARYTRRAVMV